MSYLKHLSRDRLELDAADAVICVDSKELPCHLVLLSCISPVLASSAGLEGTRPRDDGRRVITFTKSLHTAEIFLEWAYCRGPMNLTATEAMDLAIVSHTWDIPGKFLPFPQPNAFICAGVKQWHAYAEDEYLRSLVGSGLADLCDRALVQCVAVSPNFFSTTKPTGQEPNLSLLEWAALAGKCELQSFAPCCEAYIINHFPLVRRSGLLKCSVASYCAN